MFTRRELLSRTGTGLPLLALAALEAAAARAAAANPLAPKVAHFPAKAKHVIHLFMNGGPSTFVQPALEYHGQQPRPPGQDRTRSRRAVQVAVQVPQVQAVRHRSVRDLPRDRQTDRRHLRDPLDAHGHPESRAGPAHDLRQRKAIRPSMEKPWLQYGLGTENQNLPGFVVLCPGKPVVGPALWSNSFLPGVFQGCHIQNLDPKRVIEHIQNRYIGATTQREQLDLLNELNKLHLNARNGDDQLDARIQSLEMAFRMQTEATEAFDVSREPVKVRESYGKGYFADACLSARRLVERGVRMVQVFYGSGQPWDDHGDLEKGHRAKAKDSDKAIAALLKDLKAKGLLDETLVLWGGEFGRTPTSEGASGRDHNNHGFCVWLAGGGVKGGMTYGQSDEFGFAAMENKVHVHDLHATILHLMGIDHEKLTYRYSGRDFRLTDVYGTVVKDIIR
ncbi:MAG: DUF1501 domain-containing protein [Gemmataceae bacterium]